MPLGISEEQIQHTLSSIPRFYSCYCCLREILQEVLFVILAVQYFYFIYHLLVVLMTSKSLKDIFTLIKKKSFYLSQVSLIYLPREGGLIFPVTGLVSQVWCYRIYFRFIPHLLYLLVSIHRPWRSSHTCACIHRHRHTTHLD